MSNKLNNLIQNLINDLEDKVGSKCVQKKHEQTLLALFEEARKQAEEIITENFPKRAERSTREKKLKDPDAPKKAKTAYMFYCEQERAKEKEKPKDQQMKAKELMSAMGASWKELQASTKDKHVKRVAKLVALATQDKARYTEEMKNYMRPDDETLQALPINQKKTRGRSKSPSGSPKPKTKRDPKKPKAQLTAWGAFCKFKRENNDTGMTGKDLTPELSRLWKAGENKNAKWKKQAEADKPRYEREMKEYEENKENEENDEQKEENEDIEADDENEDEAEEKTKPKASPKPSPKSSPKPSPKSSPKSSPKASPVQSDAEDEDEVEEEVKPKKTPKSKKSKSKKSKAKSSSDDE
jgi:hypothetical protein